MELRRIGIWAAFSGVCVQLAGLGLDGIMHARDIHLAANEGVFTLTNPSHALLFFGMALTVAGVLILSRRSSLAPANYSVPTPSPRPHSSCSSPVASAASPSPALGPATPATARPRLTPI